MSECSLHEIIKMKVVLWMNALYVILLEWEVVYGFMLFIYYENERWCMSECSLRDIIKMNNFIYEGTYDNIKMSNCMCLNSLYVILIKWVLAYVWILFIWYYENESWNTFECSLLDIITIWDRIFLKALYVSLLKWEILYGWMLFTWYY